MGKWLISVCLLACVCAALCKDKDMMRKSIVFDKKTPDVFYCPQHKPTGMDKLFVNSRPLSKLCEHDGNPLPEDYKSDCYNDVDESEYACKEKFRIMMRLHPPGSDDVETLFPQGYKKEKDRYIKFKRYSSKINKT